MISGEHVTATTSYFFLIRWGEQGGPGNIRTATADALDAALVGSAAGGNRNTMPVRIGGRDYRTIAMDIAFAARLTGKLTDAQQLAWYRALRAMERQLVRRSVSRPREPLHL